MDRAEADLLFCRKWEERRLAYRIRGRKRGVYALTYFKADPDKITPLERDAKLAENILRLLVLRADDVTPEFMERMVPTRGAEAPPVAADGPAEAVPKVEVEAAPKAEAKSSDGTKDGVDSIKKSEVAASESAGADSHLEEATTDDV